MNDVLFASSHSSLSQTCNMQPTNIQCETSTKYPYEYTEDLVPDKLDKPDKPDKPTIS